MANYRNTVHGMLLEHRTRIRGGVKHTAHLFSSSPPHLRFRAIAVQLLLCSSCFSLRRMPMHFKVPVDERMECFCRCEQGCSAGCSGQNTARSYVFFHMYFFHHIFHALKSLWVATYFVPNMPTRFAQHRLFRRRRGQESRCRGHHHQQQQHQHQHQQQYQHRP